MKQIIFWDIDSTIINGDWNAPDIQVRPFFKELLLATWEHFDHILYTAADSVHVFHVCATLVRDWGISPLYGKQLYDTALSCDNCPMIWIDKVYEKCLDKAVALLNRKIEDVHVHIDDHPDISRWTRQELRMWCPPYEGDVDDTFFYTLLERFRGTGLIHKI